MLGSVGPGGEKVLVPKEKPGRAVLTMAGVGRAVVRTSL